MALRERQERVFQGLESLNSDSEVSIIKAPNDFEDDDRMCLTYLYVLPDVLKAKIRPIIDELRKVDPNQYYYKDDSLHMTIQCIRQIADSPNFTQGDVAAVSSLSEHITSHKPLSLDMDGLFMMPTSLGIRCFHDQESHDFIHSLRNKLVEIGVPDDKKYFDDKTIVANMTLCRFYNKPNEKFLETFNKLKSINFGKLNVDKIHLVSTNGIFQKERRDIYGVFNFA